MMIEISVNNDALMYAQKQAKEMGKINNSITNGRGNIAGFLGEKVVSDYIGPPCKIENTRDYDLVCDGVKVDVKTKRTSVEPKPHYECSVAATSTHQKCDTYIFARVSYDLKKCWILGKIKKNKYFKIARLMRKGEIDRANNYTVRADCYNLPAYSLTELQKYKGK